MVHMLDLFNVRVGLDRNGTEATHLGHDRERRVQGRQGLHVRRRAHVFVMIEDRDAVDVLDRKTTESLNRPSSQAVFALFWLSTA